MIVAIILCSFLSRAEVVPAEDARRGEYLVRAAGCVHCHSRSPDNELAGGVHIDTPFGRFFSPNISPDRETGIGNWTEAQFQKALREGVSPSGAFYYPVFPYRSYAKLTDSDVHDIYVYLNSFPSIKRRNEPHQIHFPYNQRWLLWFWQELNFSGRRRNLTEQIKTGIRPFTPLRTRSATWNRGAYLAEALLHCTECHTPRNFLGGLESSQWMAGSDIPVGGMLPPNITPEQQTGLGTWTQRDWSRFLASGFTPQNTTPSGEMAQIIQNTSALTVEDREALVEYLMSINPIERRSVRTDE